MNQCQYLNLYETATHRMKSKPCNKPVTQAQAWCKEHAYCSELLQLAKALDYPPYVIAYIDGKPVYTLYGTKGNWEAYAARHPKRRHDELTRRMKAELARRLEMVA